MANRKRRGRGEGSISQRADGLWVARITTGYDSNGKRKRRTVYGKTKQEAMDKLSRLQNQKLDGTLGDATRETVAAFLERWLEDSVRTTVRPSTIENYRRMVKNHINPRIGGVKLAKLTPGHIQSVYSEMERAEAAAGTRLIVHAILNKACKLAVRQGTILRNPCAAVDAPKSQHTEIRPLTPEQARAFLKATEGDRLHAMYVLALTTGARQGELYALRWADVDLEAGALSIRQTVVQVDNRPTVGPPKTAKSRRRIELSATAVEALLDHRRKMLAEGHAGAEWVFPDTDGGLLRRQNVHRRSFKPALEAAGLPDFRFHDLRHTSATLMLLAGVNAKVVSEMLGHSKIGMTLDLYSHVLPTMQREAADKMDSVLKLA